jgi:hypothetical protein
VRITIQPQDDAGTELGTDRELRRAFTVLHNAGESQPANCSLRFLV